MHLKLDYVNTDGDISNYHQDFFMNLSDKETCFVATKRSEEFDLPLKMQRLQQWREDINRVQNDVCCDFIYVDEESFSK